MNDLKTPLWFKLAFALGGIVSIATLIFFAYTIITILNILKEAAQ